MRMYRCDRCGELVPITYKGFVRKPSRGVYRLGRKQHLCPDCSESFRAWFKDGDAERAEREGRE